MSNFNATRKSNPFDTVNHEGMAAHTLNPLEQLFTKSLGSFFGESTFYEERDAQSDFDNLKETISKVPDKDLEYVFKIAALSRYSSMIQYPLHLYAAALMDPRMKGEKEFSLDIYTLEIIRRSSDINDILAAYLSTGYKASQLPAKVRKSLKKRLEGFDKFKLSKGLNKGSSVSLADSIKILHPTPKGPDMAEFYKDIIEGKVTAGNGKKQFAAVSSAIGKGEATKEDLAESISNSSVLAIIKNIRTMFINGIFDDEENVQKVIEILSNPEQIRRSHILPYRFYQAYKVVSSEFKGIIRNKLLNALSDALDMSIQYADPLEGFNAYLIDISGSMKNPVSAMSNFYRIELAALLGITAYKRGEGDLYLFANEVALVDCPKNTPAVVMMDRILSTGLGGSTLLDVALDCIAYTAKSNNMKYDNLIMISDGDCYNSWAGTRTPVITSDARISLCITNNIFDKFWLNDVSGAATTILNTNSPNKNILAGFTERFIDIINIYGVLGSGKDIRKVIDIELERLRSKESIH